jgi:signal transduction histidine kinase
METLRKDGRRVPILVGVATLDDSRRMAVTTDLTERKNAELGQAAAEQALRLTEEQLRQSQKMDAVGRLAGGVAHDFNNLLSVILSYSELILRDLKPQDPLRFEVDEIRKAATRAAGLTKQLLLLSRQRLVEPKVIDPRELLMSMHGMLERIVGEDVDLVLVTPKSVGRVRADASHLEQVVLNLVVNARDAMPRGGKLTIETASAVLDENYVASHFPTKAGVYVMIAVSDTGIGIPRELQPRIFEPFFTTKEHGKGTGLGLSTVFGIVQQSGGSIWVYSEPGQGTTFKVYLPRIDAEADVQRPTVAPATLRGTETILIVEDEEQVGAVILAVLRRQGYRVLAAKHPGEALLLCERHPEAVDLLLTDVVMPHMSGPELAKRLGQTRPNMKVLCMSGYTDDSVFRHGVLESGIAFLQKPITPASLMTKVREVLDQRGVS